ncbi:CpaF family protein [Oceanimonas sp. MB9]|uniref:CpaF family protein n=1 Tax=Oceanimonas sp. MB9 TaxID=2588453 RepID=UPI0013F631A4|nr:CpaF family protein [Oceanimonas sp. MB9]NHI02296.1 putative conjugal transfer protein [Oceanimonas sp. MB9]
MKHESRFGDGHGQGNIVAFKGALHRYIIEALEEHPDNLLDRGRHQLTPFVNAQVADYARSRHIPISRYEQEQLSEELVDELVGFGPLEVLLKDPEVTEILVNGPSRLFIERRGVLQRSDLRFIDDAHLVRVIQRILAPVGRRLDESSPMVDARMPDGSRINAVIPPVAIDGPALSVRKFRQDMLKSTDLLASGSLDQGILSFLELAVERRCNILVSGGTGTGKTTMLNLLSQHISPAERIVTIEDTAELQLKHEHVVRLETRPPNADGYGEIAARELVRNALRMRPDRIILGEIRGVEVLDVLTAMNTGHDGSMTTIHANNAQDALLRLESLVGLSGVQVAERRLRQTVCSAIDVVVQLVRLADGRRCVSEILEVISLRENQYVTHSLFRLQHNGIHRFVQESAKPCGDKLQNLP